MKNNELAFSYKEGSKYEAFMYKAFNISGKIKPWMRDIVMRNLIDSENGELCVSHLESFEKQLIKIKKYMNDALDRLLRRNLSAKKKDLMARLKLIIEQASTSRQLMNIIEICLNII